MLAQNFKTAEDLGLASDQHAALVKVLGMLDRQELRHVQVRLPDHHLIHATEKHAFNMCVWDGCGTAHCIGGWAEKVSGVSFGRRKHTPQLFDLFYPPLSLVGYDYSCITTQQAAYALRSYLTTGDSRWEDALKLKD